MDKDVRVLKFSSEPAPKIIKLTGRRLPDRCRQSWVRDGVHHLCTEGISAAQGITARSGWLHHPLVSACALPGEATQL